MLFAWTHYHINQSVLLCFALVASVPHLLAYFSSADENVSVIKDQRATGGRVCELEFDWQWRNMIHCLLSLKLMPVSTCII